MKKYPFSLEYPDTNDLEIWKYELREWHRCTLILFWGLFVVVPIMGLLIYLWCN